MGGFDLAKRAKNLKREAAGVVKHDFVYEALTFFLLFGIFYLGVSGAMMIALRVEAPLRPVMYNCMRHDGDETWRVRFEKEGYDDETISKFPFQGGFEEGDMLIVQGVGSPDEISVGDVIVFDYQPGAHPYVHRVLKTPAEATPFFVTKGDANPSPDPRPVYFENIRGKAIFVIPNLGWFSPSLWRR